jgi:undecaprenyl pyrophosphate phosphatase UppP
MTKQQIWEWFANHSKQILDFLLFLMLVSMGAFVKVLKQVRQGAKASWKWFLAEAIVSFFVALLVYGFFDQFLHTNQLFTYVVCAWCGSFSTIFHKRMEDLLGAIFDKLKQLINEKTSL